MDLYVLHLDIVLHDVILLIYSWLRMVLDVAGGLRAKDRRVVSAATARVLVGNWHASRPSFQLILVKLVVSNEEQLILRVLLREDTAMHHA